VLLGSAVIGCDATTTGEADDESGDGSVAQALEPVRVANAAELARMEEYARNLYDPRDVVHTFRTKSHDVVDCVPLHAQPALRAPGMRGHVIQRAPTSFAGGADQKTGTFGDVSLNPEQEFLALGGRDENGADRRCPEDTVPILRLDVQTLKRYRTLADFRSKYPSHLGVDPRGALDGIDRQDDLGDAQAGGSARSALIPPRVGSAAHHQYAHAYQSVNNWGAESNLNVWNPYTERASEFSLSQIWVTRGGGSSLETVEVGWQKYRDLYGDYNARLFIYFTPDNYGSGGCYNLTCGAFVQTNSSVIIGGSFSNYSAIGGTQYSIKLLWYKDGTTGHWWLKYGDTWVGYYPRSKFDSNGLSDSAALVDFGGEIIDTQGDGVHTGTDMGSGNFAYLGWQQAAFQRNIQYVDTSNFYRSPSLTGTYTDYWCYDILLYSDASWGKYFYFGGSGNNTYCQ
jgi:hypothetical protein